MKNANALLLRRKATVILPKKAGKTSLSLVATFNQNLQALGYTLSRGLITTLQKVNNVEFVKFANEVEETLAEVKGVRNYKPMYPNFPTQVMEASDAELYINAILHYFSFVVSDVLEDPDIVWLPKYKKERREPLDEKVKLTVLKAGRPSDAAFLLQAIVSSNTNISETDKADMLWLVQNGYASYPSVIPNKENAAVYGAALLSVGDPTAHATFPEWFKTATDVLRLATAISGGDVSLAEDTKFKSFKRRERKLLLDLLDQTGNTIEDMVRNQNRWIALGERLHPREFANRYKFAAKAFSAIRTNKGIPQSFAGQVEAAIVARNIKAAVKLLSQRPGEFARRLDHLLTLDSTKFWIVLDAFREVVDRVSTPVLLQVIAHFKNRNTDNMRVIFPKGNLAKVQAIEGARPVISASVCLQLVFLCESALGGRFQELPKLGKTYVDPKLEDYLVPFSQRSASKSARTLVRGSRIAFGTDKDTLRFFIWWKNIPAEQVKADEDRYDRYGETGRVDLDLSAVMYDGEWNHKGHVAYFNLRESEYKAVHSGDITNAPHGACEFIDIDIPSILTYGGRYILMSVNSFTGQKFSEIPEVFAGWMLRSNSGKKGEIFDPKTVVDKIDVTSESAVVMPLIIDCLERKVIWADAGIDCRNAGYGYRHGRRAGSNIANTYDTITLIGKAFTKISKPNLYDLFTLHAQARGKVVNDPTKADTIFSVETGTPFELETIASEFMKDAPKAPVKELVTK